MTVDKELLFKPRLPEADVEVAGLGTVRVRGLSRAEAMKLQSITGLAAVERAMLAMALVAPALSEGEVRQWQDAATASELEPVTNKVAELSGMNEGAAKATFKEFEADPAAEFRALPGPETGDDGGEAPDRDVGD